MPLTKKLEQKAHNKIAEHNMVGRILSEIDRFSVNIESELAGYLNNNNDHKRSGSGTTCGEYVIERLTEKTRTERVCLQRSWLDIKAALTQYWELFNFNDNPEPSETRQAKQLPVLAKLTDALLSSPHEVSSSISHRNACIDTYIDNSVDMTLEGR